MLNKQHKDTRPRERTHSNRINDNWFTVIGLSLSVFLGFGSDARVHFPRTLTDVLVIGCYGVCHLLIWTLIVYTVRKTRKKYPDADQSFNRFFITSGICLCVFFFINLGAVAFVNYLEPARQLVIDFKTVGQNLAKTTIGIWMIAGMYEALYQQFLLKETQQEKNELLRMHMQQQFDNLKGKVNPHFLFNSLNTLSSLIYTDTEKAEQFVEELSAVYRYLLKNNEDNLATLKEEIGFITSYFILIKIRFGEAIFTSVDMDEKLAEHRLPAISLQLLVENAIKHNVVSKETPLHITIHTEKEKLIVKNNLQKKPQTLSSEKMGLNYIISQYARADFNGVEIEDEHKEFCVKLTLIKPAEPEGNRFTATKNKAGIHE